MLAFRGIAAVTRTTYGSVCGILPLCATPLRVRRAVVFVCVRFMVGLLFVTARGLLPRDMNDVLLRAICVFRRSDDVRPLRGCVYARENVCL